MLDIAVEPAGATYQALVRLGLGECRTFSLITRPDLRTASSAAQLLKDLSPWLLDDTSVRQWPGTELLNDTAVLHRFRAKHDAEPILARVGRLYGWLAPDYPEDLAFYNADGSVWLGSCAHEGFAYFESVRRSATELEQLIPGLQIQRRSVRGDA